MVDIGCNEGLVTLRATSRFLCSSVVGIEIDKKLVQKAVRALVISRKVLRSWDTEGSCTTEVASGA
jgi:tRNA1(Val) A37 N6-methylase TrmN6